MLTVVISRQVPLLPLRYLTQHEIRELQSRELPVDGHSSVRVHTGMVPVLDVHVARAESELMRSPDQTQVFRSVIVWPGIGNADDGCSAADIEAASGVASPRGIHGDGNHRLTE